MPSLRATPERPFSKSTDIRRELRHRETGACFHLGGCGAHLSRTSRRREKRTLPNSDWVLPNFEMVLRKKNVVITFPAATLTLPAAMLTLPAAMLTLPAAMITLSAATHTLPV